MESFHGNINLNDKRILITGGSGFIGSHLVDYFLNHKAKEVIAFDNLFTGFEENLSFAKTQENFTFLKQDLINYDSILAATEGIDYVLHQAAVGSVPRSVKEPIVTIRSNVMGFLNMLDACRINKVKRIVYASSSSVYGDEASLPKIESKIGKALSPYAATKYSNEYFASNFNFVYNSEIIGLRYFNVFGPKQNPAGPYAAVLPIFIEAMQNNTAVNIHGDGEQTRDFTYIENVVQANVKALFTENKNALGEVFNIAYGERFSLNQIFNLLKEQMNYTLSPIYTEARAGDIKHSLANIEKAKTLLNYQPKINMREGLKRTIQSFTKI